MYAIIETGGKQYRVAPGDIIQVEKLSGHEGESLILDKVLFLNSQDETSQKQIQIGKPYLDQAKVQAEVITQGRGEKLKVLKKKRRKGYRKMIGHRQEKTEILVTGIDNGEGEKLSLSEQEKKTTLKQYDSQLTPRPQERAQARA